MTQITATMVKELRTKTGAGMMDAKKALVETGGDIDKAADALRIKGIAKAGKKSGRATGEGAVAIAINGTKGALVEVNTETDFVARNDKFQAFALEVAKAGLDVADADALKASQQEKLTEMIATVGENMSINRHALISVSKGAIAGYAHGDLSNGLGKIGVLVGLESDASADKLQEIGKKIAMHVAAANPISLDRNSIASDVVENEKQVLIAQAVESGKPKEIAEKMVDGRMNKFYAEQCLVEQKLVMNPDISVGEFVEQEAKSIGSDIKLTGFVRIALGQ